MSESNIKFVGEVSDQKLQSCYQDAKALIIPQFEDFGIVSVEAQSFGVPVIAYGKGGAKDTVIDGKTGILFNKQDVKELKQIIANLSKIGFNHSYIRSNAKRFSKSQFQRLFQRSLIRTYLLWWRRNKTVAILQGKKS
jgi:glycosyltransferase involved in cell wall biosynthesis